MAANQKNIIRGSVGNTNTDVSIEGHFDTSVMRPDPISTLL